MNIRNYYLFAGIIMTLISMVILLSYVIPQQLKEVLRPKSYLTPSRIVLFIIQVSYLFALVPGLTRSFQVLDLPITSNWARVAAITNRVPYLLGAFGYAYFYWLRDRIEK